MEPHNMELRNELRNSPRELAKKFEAQLKDTVAKKFGVAVDELSLLQEDEQGSYFSEQERNTLCSFVLGNKNGYLYLVTAELKDDGQSLQNFKTDIVS